MPGSGVPDQGELGQLAGGGGVGVEVLLGFFLLWDGSRCPRKVADLAGCERAGRHLGQPQVPDLVGLLLRSMA